MKRSAIRESNHAVRPIPDYAPLHPGYEDDEIVLYDVRSLRVSYFSGQPDAVSE